MNPCDPAAYEWPEPTRATLLAGLAATRDADERARWARPAAGCVVKGHVMAAGYAVVCLFASWINLRKGAKR